MNVGAVGKRKFGRTGGRQFVLMLGVALLVAACRQAPPALDTATQTVTPEGGVVTLPGGVTATFAPGFFAAEGPVTLSVSDAAPVYPAAVAADYRGAEPVAPGVTVTLPAAALAAPSGLAGGPTLALRVPATAPVLQTEGSERLLAEVHLHLADGQHLFFLESYARLEGETGQEFEGTDTVTLHLGQLRPDGPATAEDVRVVVRPVRLGGARLEAQALPAGFTFETVVSGLSGGVAFDFTSDGRIFIAEKGGVVKVVQGGRAGVFANLSAQVNNIQDRGMLGLAVHPQFPKQPYVYVLFTYDPPETAGVGGYGGSDNRGARVARLVRLTADAGQNYNVATDGGTVLLGLNSTFANIGAPAARNGAPSCGPVGAYVQDCLPADEWSHTVGALRFAPDGSLFVSNGDGANYNAVQDYAVRSLDLDSLAGKILRIDPLTGQGYGDNPFYNGDPNSNRSKVYSYGLRNPFRFALHPQTGALYAGDVGWGTWEEINRGRGQNFGWPCFEGGNGNSLQQGGYRSLARCAALYPNPGVTPSLYAYDHSAGGSSVQLGDFYTGTRYPAQYRGALFFSDINRQWVRYLTLNASGGFASVGDFATEGGTTQISAGPAGDLYFMNIYAGTLRRLRYTAPATVPIAAAISATPVAGDAPLPVAFSSAGSTGTGALTYSWNFGDGATSAEANPVHTYAEKGSYRAILTVGDAVGESSSSSLTVQVSNGSPTATILSPANGVRYTVGDAVPFSGQGTDPEQGELPGSALRWTVNMRHNEHAHLDGLPPTTGEAGSFVTEDHGDNTSLELCLKATDDLGETGTKCVSLYPNTVAYTLDTVPTGLELPWEGTLRRTPFTVTTNVNAAQQLIAPAAQGDYAFVGWSDGGAREHPIRIGAAPARLVATYRSTVVTLPPPPPAGTVLAWEGQTFTVSSATPVRYGADTRWTQKTVTGTAGCSNVFFGTDPAVGVRKSCVVAGGTTPPPTTAKLSITALCRDRWLVRNPLTRSVPYNWTVLNTGRKGSRTATPGSEYRLWIASGSSRVTFYADGRLYGTLTPRTTACR